MSNDSIRELDASWENLRETARVLLARGNHLQQEGDAGVLELRAGTQPQPPTTDQRVMLESPACNLSIVLEQERGASPLGDLHWQDYDGEARLLAWSLAHEDLLAALSQLFGGALLPTAFRTSVSDDQAWLELAWRDHANGEQRGWLGLTREAIQPLADSAGWKRDSGRLSTIGRIDAVTLNLIVPGRLLDAASMAALVIGDVLLMGTEVDCEGRLQPDREKTKDVFGLPDGWAVRLQQGQWMVTAKAVLNSSIEPARPQFLITSLTAPLEEVSRLQPGSVAIQEASLIGSTVGIVLHGRRFGEGELVGMGAWLGVRITHKEGGHGSR
ncbi:hypothetical protein ACPPVV_08120 [Rhodanobacter sp. Col0626]|uniref:hypothetical protein n=1 Tax=Rhodanobacter sp. Col0626 TaxID=3415679 RepID=UPI003CEC3155